VSDWDPDLYRRFEQERTRPAVELLARVPLNGIGHGYDLGCGPGNSTELLVRRFGKGRVTGLDMSDAMLDSARQRLPDANFVRADISTWQPEAAPDLIYANAALQWVPDHRMLVPRLFGLLAPGGVLAVQMPDNLDEPSHRAMHEVATRARWTDSIGDAGAARAVIQLAPADYYDLLAPVAAEVEVWRTTYFHVMDGGAAIVSWVRATGLKAFVDPLPPEQQAEYLSSYEAEIEKAYPVRADGRRLLAFPRLFFMARKAA